MISADVREEKTIIQGALNQAKIMNLSGLPQAISAFSSQVALSSRGLGQVVLSHLIKY